MPWRLPLTRSGARRPRHARAGAGAARGSGRLRSSLARLSAPRPDERQAGTGKRRFSRTRKQRVGRAAGGQITRYKRRTSLRVTDTLPQGEQLARLARFLGPHPFYPAHARRLLERSLIDTVTVTALEGMPASSAEKVLGPVVN